MDTPGKFSLRNSGPLLLCAARYWSEDNASTIGAALAFFCAFSLAPLLVILLTIAGGVLGEQQAYGQVQVQMQALFGPASAKIVMDAVRASTQTKGLISTVVSVITLIIGASTVFTVLQTALNQIWRSASMAPAGLRGLIRVRLLSFGFILALGFLLLVSLTLSTGLSNLRAQIARAHPSLVGSLVVVDVAISLTITAALFALIYRYMPAQRQAWKTVITGGILTALLFDAGRWGIGLYLSHSTQPSAFGAAASFAALLLWLYYSAQIFLFGAEFTACLAGVSRTLSPAASLAAPSLPNTNPSATNRTTPKFPSLSAGDYPKS